MPKAVICIATSEEQAANIANQLKEAGLSGHDVSVLLPDRAGSRDFARDPHNSKAPEGAATGAIAGGVTAGILGWLFGIGTAGIPEPEATLYEGMAESGDAFISVHTEERKHNALTPHCEWCRNARRRKSLMAYTPAKPRTSGNLRMRTA